MISDRYKTIFFAFLLLSFSVFILGLYFVDLKSEKLIKASLFFPVYLDKKLPEISIYNAEGSVVKSDLLSKGLVLLHFWATWCSSCEKELYSLSNLNREKFSLFCISIDENPSDAIEYFKKRDLKIPLYFDKNSNVAKTLGSSKFPETYVLYNGKIILKFEGPRDWAEKDLIEFIYTTAGVN